MNTDDPGILLGEQLHQTLIENPQKVVWALQAATNTTLQKLNMENLIPALATYHLEGLAVLSQNDTNMAGVFEQLDETQLIALPEQGQKTLVENTNKTLLILFAPTIYKKYDPQNYQQTLPEHIQQLAGKKAYMSGIIQEPLKSTLDNIVGVHTLIRVCERILKQTGTEQPQDYLKVLSQLAEYLTDRQQDITEKTKLLSDLARAGARQTATLPPNYLEPALKYLLKVKVPYDAYPQNIIAQLKAEQLANFKNQPGFIISNLTDTTLLDSEQKQLITQILEANPQQAPIRPDLYLEVNPTMFLQYFRNNPQLLEDEQTNHEALINKLYELNPQTLQHMVVQLSKHSEKYEEKIQIHREIDDINVRLGYHRELEEYRGMFELEEEIDELESQSREIDTIPRWWSAVRKLDDTLALQTLQNIYDQLTTKDKSLTEEVHKSLKSLLWWAEDSTTQTDAVARWLVEQHIYDLAYLDVEILWAHYPQQLLAELFSSEKKSFTDNTKLTKLGELLLEMNTEQLNWIANILANQLIDQQAHYPENQLETYSVGWTLLKLHTLALIDKSGQGLYPTLTGKTGIFGKFTKNKAVEKLKKDILTTHPDLAVLLENLNLNYTTKLPAENQHSTVEQTNLEKLVANIADLLTNALYPLLPIAQKASTEKQTFDQLLIDLSDQIGSFSNPNVNTSQNLDGLIEQLQPIVEQNLLILSGLQQATGTEISEKLAQTAAEISTGMHKDTETLARGSAFLAKYAQYIKLLLDPDKHNNEIVARLQLELLQQAQDWSWNTNKNQIKTALNIENQLSRVPNTTFKTNKKLEKLHDRYKQIEK